MEPVDSNSVMHRDSRQAIISLLRELNTIERQELPHMFAVNNVVARDLPFILKVIRGVVNLINQYLNAEKYNQINKLLEQVDLLKELNHIEITEIVSNAKQAVLIYSESKSTEVMLKCESRINDEDMKHFIELVSSLHM